MQKIFACTMLICAMITHISTLSASKLIELAKFFYVVKEEQAIVLERWGQFHKVLRAGVHLKVPGVDCARQVFWRDRSPVSNQLYDASSYKIDVIPRMRRLPTQQIDTQDPYTVSVGGIMYYRIADPKMAAYAQANVPISMEGLAITSLRSLVGDRTLEQLIHERDELHSQFLQRVSAVAQTWGIEMIRIMLEEVRPPREIVAAMEQRKIADIRKETTIIEAEAEKQRTMIRAAGAAEAIKSIESATGSSAAAYMLAQEYIQNLPDMVKGANAAVIVPSDAMPVAGLLAATKHITTQPTDK